LGDIDIDGRIILKLHIECYGVGICRLLDSSRSGQDPVMGFYGNGTGLSDSVKGREFLD
jgi:hypothetical protein